MKQRPSCDKAGVGCGLFRACRLRLAPEGAALSLVGGLTKDIHPGQNHLKRALPGPLTIAGGEGPCGKTYQKNLGGCFHGGLVVIVLGFGFIS